MLRKTRMFVVVFFIISLVVFTLYRIARSVTTDRTIPVIEMDSESITVSVKEGDAAILKGVTATDAKDGDITENLFIESRTSFLEKGVFNVTIAVVDKDNHVTKAERNVIYSDYSSPQFSLSGPLEFAIARGNTDDLNIAADLSAKDVIDGNISSKIKMSDGYFINQRVPGDYPMEFVVTNSMGDTTKLPVTISIYNSTEKSGLPQIILSKYLINTTAGTEVDISALINQIEYHNDTFRRGDDGNFYNGDFDINGNLKMYPASNIHIDSEVEWNVPGVYETTIYFIDEVAGINNYTRCYIVVN